jgi:hypothetical protein
MTYQPATYELGYTCLDRCAARCANFDLVVIRIVVPGVRSRARTEVPAAHACAVGWKRYWFSDVFARVL